MKNFFIALFLCLMFHEIAQTESSLPECEGKNYTQWTNCFGWGDTVIKIYTHAINDLSEHNFILVAKIDKINNV